MNITRRKLLQTAGLVAGGMLLPIGKNSLAVRGVNLPTNRQRLIVVFLRGGADGLNIVVPHQETDYYEARPTIGLPYPQEQEGVLDLDGFFGLNPALRDIMPLWKQGSLAFLHCSGSPNESRSHFDAQDYMESGIPGTKNVSDGWMNRLIATLPHDLPTQALNVGTTTPRILKGKMTVASISRGRNSATSLPVDKPVVSNAFDRLYDNGDTLSKVYQEGRQARNIIMADLQAEMLFSGRGAPSANEFIDDAKEVARLMKGDAKTQLAFMDISKWDTHINQKNHLNKSLQFLGEGLATLTQELDSLYKDTVIVIISEFGRTVQENGNGGTDHGHGNVMFLLGGGIRGGKVYGSWQGLSESNLYEGRDLPVTTDFREAIASVIMEHLQVSTNDIQAIFPDYQFLGNLSFLS